MGGDPAQGLVWPVAFVDEELSLGVGRTGLFVGANVLEDFLDGL